MAWECGLGMTGFGSDIPCGHIPARRSYQIILFFNSMCIVDLTNITKDVSGSCGKSMRYQDARALDMAVQQQRLGWVVTSAREPGAKSTTLIGGQICMLTC